MAPRAGFEVARKLLNARIAKWVEEQNTPTGTPLSSRLEFSTLSERVDAFAGWPTEIVPSSAE
jgi:hypothetical protein